MTPRKVGVEQKGSGRPDKERDGFRLACLGSIKNRVTELLSTFSGIIHSADQSAMTSRAD